MNGVVSLGFWHQPSAVLRQHRGAAARVGGHSVGIVLVVVVGAVISMQIGPLLQDG